MINFKGKVAVITGGNSGFGYATAKELATQGATVIITGRRAEAIEIAAKEIGATGIVADQANLADTEKLVTEVSKNFGKVDILFINAGIVRAAPIEYTQEADFDNVMNVNFKGAYFMLSKFIPLLNEDASVVLLSSISATLSTPNTAVYAASKAALSSFTKIAAIELASRKIRVNSISPGTFQTELLSKIGLDDETLSAIRTSQIAENPISKLGDSNDIAKMVVYLSSDSASFITGSDFVIDGGKTIKV